MRRLRVSFRLWLRKLVHQKDTPKRIAGGAALGSFIAVTPTFGIQMPLSLLLAWILRVNKKATFLMIWLTNVFTIAPVYYFCYRLGLLLLPGYRAEVGWERFEALARNVSGFDFLLSWEGFVDVIGAAWHLGRNAALPLWLGCVILGGVLAAIVYPLTIRLVRVTRERRFLSGLKWRLMRKEKREAAAAEPCAAETEPTDVKAEAEG
jgi:hypothetical protein